MTLSIVLNWGISTLLWDGDLEEAEDLIDRFITIAEYHSLGSYFAVIRGRKAQIAIYRGEPASGVENLRHSVAEFHATHYELLTTEFNVSFSQGINALGKNEEGLALVDETMRSVELNGDFSYMPEVLRVKGNLLLSGAQVNEDAAEHSLRQSIDWSGRQGGSAWKVRADIDLA